VRQRERNLISVVAGICGSLFAGCATLCQDWSQLILRSTGPPKRSPAQFGLAYENVRFPSANGNQLAGWFVPSASGKPLATFLIHTGMRGNLDTYLYAIPWAAKNDFSILVYDWQGFGDSEGTPSFANWEPDMHAAVDYLLARPDTGAGIIQLGASLGAIPGMAATAAYPDQTIGLVLYGGFFTENIPESWLIYEVSPLLATTGLIANTVWNTLLPDFFDGPQYLAFLQTPILLITPTDDDIVPVREQDRLYAALPDSKQRYFTYGGHVHAPETDPNLGPTVIAWAKALPALQPHHP
jgi:alpha-beta hydrolase superfamily lysophospholipase